MWFQTNSKMNKTWDILRQGDFHYLTLTLHYFPEFVLTKKRPCIFEDDRGAQASMSFPTEILYIDTRFDDGEKYYWAFSAKLLGFGFTLRRQTSY